MAIITPHCQSQLRDRLGLSSGEIFFLQQWIKPHTFQPVAGVDEEWLLIELPYYIEQYDEGTHTVGRAFIISVGPDDNARTAFIPKQRQLTPEEQRKRKRRLVRLNS